MLYWDTNGATPGLGGTGDWDLTTANWTTDPTGSSATQAWNNAAGDTAVFAGTAGAVNLSSDISAAGLRFDTSDYTLGNHAILLGGSAQVNVATGVAATLVSPLGGGSGLTKLGGGTLVIANSSHYTGSTQVDEGTLVFQNTYASANYSIASGATLELNTPGGAVNYISTVFTGAGTLRKTGAGTAVWGASAATFALGSGGLIDVQQGTFFGGHSANENWTNNQANLNVASGAEFNGVEANVRVGALSGEGVVLSGWDGEGYSTFTFGVGDASGTFAGTLTHFNGIAYGHYTKTGTGTQTFTGTINQIADGGNTGLTIDGGTVEIGGAGTFAGGSFSNAIINGGTFKYNSTATNTLGGSITGSGSLVKDGTGTLLLASAADYTGSTQVDGGTLVFQNTYASANHSIAAGAILELNVASGTRDYGGTTFTGAGTLRKTGAGTAVWGTSATTFALDSDGLIDVQQGAFFGGHWANENWTNNQSSLNVASGAEFNGWEANVRVGALTGAGIVRSGWNGEGYSTFTFGVGNATGTFAGTLTRFEGVAYAHYTKTGTGTQTFSGTINQLADTGNTGLSITSGTVTVAGAANFAGDGIAIAAGAVLDLNVASGTRDYGGTVFTGAGTLRKTGAGTAVWGEAATTFALGSGALIDVQQGAFFGGHWANENWTNNQASLNVASGAEFNGWEANVRVGALTGAGIVRSGWDGEDYSTFTFGVGNASGTFAGTLSHFDGVAYAHYTKTGTGTQTFTGTINQLANGYGTGLTIGSGTVEIGGAGTFAGGSFTNTILNNGTFKYNSTIDNALNGLIVGTGSLVKDSTSTLALNGPNTFTGPTTVQNGTLEVNHYVMPSAVTLQPGTTLTGSGGTGPVTNNGGNFTRDWYVVERIDASIKPGDAAVTPTGTLSYLNGGSAPTLVQAMSAVDAVFSALGATAHGGIWNSATGVRPSDNGEPFGGFRYEPNFSVNGIGPIQAIAFEDWKDNDYNDGYFRVKVQKPEVAITRIGDESAVEGSAFTLRVDLNMALPQAIDVHLHYSGVADFANDYTVPLSVIIPAGSTSTTFTLPTFDDNLTERIEENIDIYVDYGTGYNAAEFPFNWTRVVILDNDAPYASVSTSGSIDEDGATASVTVSLSKVADEDITVGLTPTGLDMARITGFQNSVTIPSGQTSASFTIGAVDDQVVQQLEHLTVLVADRPDSTFARYRPGTPSSTIIRVDDNEWRWVASSAAGVADTDTILIDVPYWPVDAELSAVVYALPSIGFGGVSARSTGTLLDPGYFGFSSYDVDCEIELPFNLDPQTGVISLGQISGQSTDQDGIYASAAIEYAYNVRDRVTATRGFVEVSLKLRVGAYRTFTVGGEVPLGFDFGNGTLTYANNVGYADQISRDTSVVLEAKRGTR